MTTLDPNRCAQVTWTVGGGGARTNITVVGVGTLPAAWLPYWRGNPADVRDLALRGHPGQGYWPIVDEPTTFDPKTQKRTGPTWTPDGPSETVTAVYEVVALSDVELAAMHAPERAVIGELITAGVAERKARAAQRKLDRRVRLLEQS